MSKYEFPDLLSSFYDEARTIKRAAINVLIKIHICTASENKLLLKIFFEDLSQLHSVMTKLVRKY